MKKASKIIILLLIVNHIGLCCSCEYESFSYDLYSNLKNSFIGTVIKVNNDKPYENAYTFRIKYVYKGKFDTIITIKSGTGGGDCGELFELNRTYLIDADYDNKKSNYHTSRCNFNALSGTKEFSEDTAFLNCFSKKHVYINLFGLKGHVKNGKPEGLWIIGQDSGFYVNGKKDGIWKVRGSDIYYKNGKFIKSIDYNYNDELTDSSKVIVSRKKQKEFYSNGILRRITTKRKLLIYYPNGKIKYKTKLNKGFVYGYIYKYDESGTLLTKEYVPNDYSIEAGFYFIND